MNLGDTVSCGKARHETRICCYHQNVGKSKHVTNLSILDDKVHVLFTDFRNG